MGQIMTDSLNENFAETAIVHTAGAEWQPSPSSSVWRKRLDLTGGAETGRVTSLVRYDADSSFPPHEHPGGEEIFVLDGVFSDETGDYPKGSYLLNPEGFTHAPYSKNGCVIFVKLQQYPGDDREHIMLQSDEMDWQPGPHPGTHMKVLYSSPDHPETVMLFRLDAGTEVPFHDHPGGEEAFVIEGEIEDENGPATAGTWVRYPVGSSHAPSTKTGCLLYVKIGHLSGL